MPAVQFYSFTPPCIMSLIKYFLPIRKTPITGIVQMTEHAKSSPQSVISRKLPLKTANPTGKVRILSVFVTIKGHIKLFQVVTKVNSESVATVGKASGSADFKKCFKNIASVDFSSFFKVFGQPQKILAASKISRNLQKAPVKSALNMSLSNAFHALRRTAELC